MASSSVRRGDRPPSKEVADEIEEDTAEESDKDEYDENSHEEKSDEVDDENDNKDDEEISSHEHDNENDDNDDEDISNKDGNLEYKGKMVVEASDIPGQPIDPHLLCYYGDQIARVVWENSNPRKNPRPLLKLHQHQDMVKTMWPIDKECAKVQEYVKNSGFYPLIKYGHHKIDRALINAFRERWYPETNTYHLPFGEMTPTIEDVERITGLPSKGEEVYAVYSGKTMTWKFMFDLIKRTLGKNEAEIKKEGALCGNPKQQKKKLKLNWLRDNFKSKEKDSKKRKEQCARAYLLYVIVSIICGDKSGGSVYAYFLQCLEDLDKVNTYSWATSCLDWLYNQLGQGSRSEIYSMAGCMTVLQVWVYDHFPTLQRHTKNSGYEDCHPRASLYVAELTTQQERNLENELADLREALDELSEDKVIWDPYNVIRDGSVYQVGHYIGAIRCFRIVEWHNPNRVLRQFGVIQDIPKGVFLDRNKTVSKPKSFRSYYPYLNEHNWGVWEKSLIPDHILKSRVENPWDCKDGYMDWFSKVSHTRVSNLFF
ncbi:hypothetical protein MKW92_025247 [Papaver armeniacum]|nr:hypothetical protein MKW92_025247 [Papaver armeniacum]